MSMSVRDPVCAMPVDPAVALRASTEGRDYYFCSDFCRESFLKDPAAALARGPTSPEDERRADRRIAYFTMEIALEPGMATYSGGLGVLAGDSVRACADLGVPLVAVTLLHRDGYLRQTLDERGNQHEDAERWTPGAFLQPLPETAAITLEGRAVRVRAWRRDVRGEGGSRVPVLFLDTDLPDNAPSDRFLTGRLYAGDERYRLAQEAVLGIGGFRILQAVGYDSLRKYHLNEGHAALATVELLRQANDGRAETEWSFADVRERCVFTTHTPVAAGHDRFPSGLVEKTLGPLVPRRVLEMIGGHDHLDMTMLALNSSGYVNGVARKHGDVARGMFPGYDIRHVTNGVHTRTWASPPFRALFDRHLPGWGADPSSLRNALSIPQEELWRAHAAAKRDLLETVGRIADRALDPEALTIGFARRATQYKRADLVFSDLERLVQVRRTAGKLQLVFAGKAHPRDEPGKDAIRRIFEAARRLGDDVPVVYLPGYDLSLAQTMIAGVDLWLNTPERPMEASGTSGMKAAVNGVPSFSVLDGWWLEGHVEGVTGWAIGSVEPAADPRAQHDLEARDLYDKLETVVAPLYYRDRAGWIQVMKQTISLNASFFHTHRMVQQYVTSAYL